MELRILTSLFFVFLFLIPTKLHSQTENYIFARLTTEQGLPNSDVHSFEMDNKGFVWFGQESGIIRWDGHHFSHQQSLQEATGIPSNIVKTMLKDEKGFLWLGTIGGGIMRFDPSKSNNAFKPIPWGQENSPKSIADPNIWTFYIDSSNDLWIGVFHKGLNRFNRKTEIFENFPLATDLKNEQEAFRRNTVMDIVEDVENPNILWLAVQNGIARFEKSTGNVRIFKSTAPKTSGMSTTSLLMDKAGELWVGTHGGGLVLFDTHTFSWNYFAPNPSAWKNRQSSGNIILDLIPKGKTELWLASQDMGFGFFNRQTKTFSFFKNDPENPLSILSNSASKIFKDNQNRIWVSHPKKGVSILEPQKPPFLYQKMPIGTCNGLYTGQITDFTFDPTRQCYFASGRSCGGIFMLDKNKRFLKKIPPEQGVNTFTNFQAIKNDTKGSIWVGAMGNLGLQETDIEQIPGLWELPPEAEKLRPFKHPALPKGNFNVHDIYEDAQQNLWFATDYLGLLKFDRTADTIIAYVQSDRYPDAPSPYVHCRRLLEDKKGRIWMATQGEGIFSFDPASEEFLKWPMNVNEVRFEGLAEDENGHIWIATGGRGLVVIDPDNRDMPVLDVITPKEGLPSYRVFDIVGDEKGGFWITTTDGLCRYDIKSKQFKRFDKHEGITNPDFFDQGLVAFPNGDVFVGQEDGFYIHEGKRENEKIDFTELVFSNFKVFSEDRIFQNDLNFFPEINLKHDENYFIIDFSDKNFTKNQVGEFSYFLEGFDKQWRTVDDGLFSASYTKVSPGNYVFHVGRTAEQGSKPIPNLSLPITITSPWYKTIWAYWVYGAIVLSLIFWYRKKELNEQQLQLDLELEKVKAEQSAELDRTKNRLTANLTHEFRTPLTVILGIAERLEGNVKRQDFAQTIQNIDSIKRNGNSLLSLITEMLDLSKLESNQMPVHLAQGDIVSFIEYILEPFFTIAADNEILLKIESNPSKINMDYDASKIQHIVNNLLSNALKFTPEGGQIKVELGEVSGIFQLKISDSGIGVEAKQLANIFDRYYQIDNSSTRKYEGTGIGLALVYELVKLLKGDIKVKSTVGKGTTFTIQLPITEEAAEASVLFELEDRKTTNLQNSVFSTKSNQPPQKEEKVASEPEDLPLLLIVEDNKDLSNYLYQILEKKYRLEFAENGQIGIDKAISLTPDIIISDVMMPEKDGFELCETLKNDVRSSHIPIILLTGRGLLEDRIAGLSRGADAYIAKPFHPTELQAQLENLVKSRKKLQERYRSLLNSEAAGAITDESVEDVFLIKLRAYIEQNIGNTRLSTDDICLHMAMSRSQLHRKISALTNLSTTIFVRNVRLKHAQQLLLSSDLTITEIAYDSGFSNPKYFSKVFAKEFGKKPSEFQQQ